jgi:hypothetical protein
MARNLIKVTYIGGSADIREDYTFLGMVWRKNEKWEKMIPLAKAEECEKHPQVFKVEWPVEFDTNSEIVELKLRLTNLETAFAKFKGGRPKKSEEE